MLDRRTGKPIFSTLERAVPAGDARGDRTSRPQPFSSVAPLPAPARETGMWGVRRCPTTSIVESVSRRSTIADRPADQISVDRRNRAATSTEVPFAIDMNPFLSFAGLPCQAPPWGYVAGLDLAAGKKVWEHKNSTIRDETILSLPFKMGVPSPGGPIAAAGGIASMVAAIDNYVRASDTQTGKVLWRAQLPAGGRATLMSYRSTASGRPFVVVAPGGHDSLGTKLSDDVIEMLCQSKKFERVQAFVAVRSHEWRARRLLEPPPLPEENVPID